MEDICVNSLLIGVIFICLGMLWGKWQGQLNKFYNDAFEEELRGRNDGSYERYLKSKAEFEEQERKNNGG